MAILSPELAARLNALRAAGAARAQRAHLAQSDYSTPTAKLVEAAEVIGTVVALTAAESYIGTEDSLDVKGIPMEAVAGAVLLGASILGYIPPQFASHARAIGTGAIASWAKTPGAKLGLYVKERVDAAKGYLPEGETRFLSTEEMREHSRL